MNIAFNVNRLAMIGLGVTLKSLLDNCSNPSKINIYILCSDLNIEDKSNIHKLLLTYGLNEVKLIDFDVNEHFGTFSSLQGDLTTYGRLLLQDYVKEDAVLYLDADLVVELDVLTLEGFDFQGKGIAAVDGGKMKDALDHPFLCNEIGLGMDLAVFNAGIILFNLKYWREKDIKNQCLAFGKKYGTKLRSHDQTILNAFFAGNFAFLPLEFNMPWFAQNKRPEAKKVILHFVGSPKPWDVLGKYVHRGFSVWKSYLNADWEKAYYHYNQGEFLRAWHIRRSYARLLLLKMKSKN
ncbi:glycosyltransferase family 8 protein [Flavobacterium phragmitis]|uniref:Lipopolysaccharide biosynthesis protein, LPS:glycosyltransferase n=1 Tax=Flavobacterium phragmitis TaxID=739143 RepID=A0A1I1Q822_9FLAO|nr:glycosyltransferase family 8 protein [Flavobacterium phragmitis]SFD16008.1 Lipopolysaccharide biosynthesis protein, LPS:glycosyltransferase [Flavobacterium phragmitis]